MSISILMDGWLLSILVSPSEHGGSSLWREKHLEVRGVIRAAWRRSCYKSRTGRYYQTARRSYPQLSSARPPKPDVIVHEMTSLSGVNNLRRFEATTSADSKRRRLGGAPPRSTQSQLCLGLIDPGGTLSAVVTAPAADTAAAANNPNW